MNDKEDRNRRQVDGMKCEEEQRWVFHTFKQDFEQERKRLLNIRNRIGLP